MYSFDTQIRVRYAETDQMGFVYYGNYATYFEIGRVETLRSLGFSYKTLENQGVMLPVKTYSIDYQVPAKYDDLLTIRTNIVRMPRASIEFTYEVMNSEGSILSTARTVLVFMDAKTQRPIRCPEEILRKLQAYFSDQPPHLA